MKIISSMIMTSTFLMATAAGAYPTPVQKAAQKTIAQYLRSQTGKGGQLAGVKKGSIKSQNIKIVGSLKGPIGPDHGSSAKFTAFGLERRLSGLPRGSFELLTVKGVDVTNSFMGPYVRIDKVSVLHAPRIALHR